VRESFIFGMDRLVEMLVLAWGVVSVYAVDDGECMRWKRTRYISDFYILAAPREVALKPGCFLRMPISRLVLDLSNQR
jgi:hypothetical protein